MRTRRARTTSTGIYLIVLLIIIVVFILLGGGAWLKGLFHGSLSFNFYNWNWVQIIISLVIGFLLGRASSRR